jgi:maltose O-acetyltransferase
MPGPTEKERMLAGDLYLASDPELVADRLRARRLTRLYNATTEDEPERRGA